MATIKLKFPKLDMSMEEAVIAQWMVNSGDEVSVGQEIYSVETDKTTMAVECPFAGIINTIGEAGGTYQIGDIVAEIELKT